MAFPGSASELWSGNVSPCLQGRLCLRVFGSCLVSGMRSGCCVPAESNTALCVNLGTDQKPH